MSYATVYAYNIMGKANIVSSCLEEFKLRAQTIFPCKPDQRDINVLIEEHEVDAFTEWCNVHSLAYKRLN